MGEKIRLAIEKQNIELAKLLRSNGIKKLRLVCLGNSISSGFSRLRTVKPLLLRNETIETVMNKNDIDLDIHHFARAQNNNDEHFFDWIISNIKESEIHKLNRIDYSGGITSMHSHGIDLKKLDEYYPTCMGHDIGLQDAILESNPDMQNIVIYNGCTGSFLDNVTRNGKLWHMLTYGIKRDICGLEATLKFIQASNRLMGSNTQVYICGAPDFLGLKVSHIINRKLKKVAEKYANVFYIKPVKSKFFYRPLDIFDSSLEKPQNMFKVRFFQPDVHYDEDEYLKLNDDIVRSIKDNYLILKSMINIDRKLYDFSSNLECNNQEMLSDNSYIQQHVTEILASDDFRFDDKKIRKSFYNKIKRYLINRFPYDFYYIGIKNLKESLKNR